MNYQELAQVQRTMVRGTIGTDHQGEKTARQLQTSTVDKTSELTKKRFT